MTSKQNESSDRAASEPLIAALPDVEQLKKTGAFWRVIELLLALGLVGMLVILIVQIVTRFMGSSPAWTEEASRFIFMDGVFLGLAAGFRMGVHPRVTYLVTKGPEWLKKLSLHVTAMCSVVFFAVVAWTAFELILQQMRTNETSPALALSMWIVTLPLALGALLALAGTIQSVYLDKDLRHRMLQGDVIA